ncbi:MAG TPA: glutathione binding-like protein, partial [Planctomycetota bacterium]|nr:glutathione binding-like protein [Planctomycetota bacterium]
RARCRQLESAADEIVFPAVWELINGGFYPAAANDTAVTERSQRAKTRVAELCEGLDKELVGREYLCGRFSVADIGTFIMLSTAASLGAPPPASCTQLQGWLARMSGRPAVRKELTEMAAHAAKARQAAA